MEDQVQTDVDELDKQKYASSMEQFELRLTPQTYVQAIMQMNPGASMRAPRTLSIKGIYCK